MTEDALKNLIARIIVLRNIARKLELFGFADDIRAMLKEVGIELRDTKSGTKIRIRKGGESNGI